MMEPKYLIIVIFILVLVVFIILSLQPGDKQKPPFTIKECNDEIDNDGDGAVDFPADAGCGSLLDQDETNCGDEVCEGGETSLTCPGDCGVYNQTYPPGPLCGNNICESYENNRNCPSDCEPACGNGLCEVGEGPTRCFVDCGRCDNDGICEARQGENTITCPGDCPLAVCGNGVCEAGESIDTCPEDCNIEECNDEIDNDGDGAVDFPADAGCGSLLDQDETNCGDEVCEGGETSLTCPGDCGPLVECNDSIDNDGDWFVDYPADRGCDSFMDDDETNCGDGVCEGGETAVTCPADCVSFVECNDSIDNDGDGAIDFPFDGGCTQPEDDDETDCGDGVCEGGETLSTCPEDCGGVAECSDEIDNDGDGYIDMIDMGCSHSGDNTEEDTRDVNQCRIDFSSIDGNIIKNPYFECDDIYHDYPNSPQSGNDSIPDYWGYLYLGRWYASPDHEKKWVEDNTIPDISTKSVLLHPITFPFPPDNRRNTIGQRLDEGFETDRWYKFTCMFNADNIIPIFLPNGSLNKSYWGSVNYIGCQVRIYHPNATNGDKGVAYRSVIVDGPRGGDWNETYGLYTSWLPGDTGGWITRTRYVYVPEGATNLSFEVINYGLANMSAAKMNFTPTDCNCDPRMPPFKKEGEVTFANFSGSDFFSIGMWGVPSYNDGTVTMSVQEIQDAGFDTVVHFSGCHLGPCRKPNEENYYHLNLTELDERGMYAMSSVYGAGHRGDIFNLTPLSNVSVLMTDRISSIKNNYVPHPSYIGVQDDEPDCHGGGFFPELREWHWFKQELIDAFREAGREDPLINIDFCGWRGTYTSDDNEDVKIWAELPDIFTYTQNFPPLDIAPPKQNTALPYYNLEEVGALMRYRLKMGEEAQGKPIVGWAFPAVYSFWFLLFTSQSWTTPQGNVNLTLLRFQVYNQIVNGASGVNWFAMLAIDLDNPTHRKNFNDIVAINSELHTLMPVLLEKQFYDFWDTDKYIEAMLKIPQQEDGSLYIIATNPSKNSKGTVTFTLKNGIQISDVKALFENQDGTYNVNATRNLAFSGNEFSDVFDGFGVHIYQLSIL